ncbi:NAD-dependent epimerase/dehydratase family protein [Raoultella ornithinolytica]|uniref:NAD-dependent epimerase/dehydratase family protein n=1 Tax=Raoultella ornithinolytica TaxID=54291 RepID=UPI001157C2D3|nr:NAD-dependent epimerase/dehydratase family protein [Raoultella ornithinolytica]
MTQKHVLIAGASGVVGKAALEAFLQAGWQVSTIGRTTIDAPGVVHLTGNLEQEATLVPHLNAFSSITHIFYTALKPFSEPGVEADINAAMFENLVEAVRSSGAPLKQVIFIQGGKMYGAHLGVYKTPAREDDSRHFPPNLYFRHQDYAVSLESKGIKWTALRPDIVIGHSLGSAMNLGNLIGIYATLCRETGTAMQFPGPDDAYRHALVNITSAKIVGDAGVWAAVTGAEGAYNITNGDVFRWSHVWPKLANWFGLEVGEPQPISLSQRLKALRPLWTDLASRHHLAVKDLDKIALGSFGDFIFHVQTDAIFDVTKARQAGFDKMVVRSEDVLISHFENMKVRNLIP